MELSPMQKDILVDLMHRNGGGDDTKEFWSSR